VEVTTAENGRDGLDILLGRKTIDDPSGTGPTYFDVISLDNFMVSQFLGDASFF
jgi:hypothetical protein